MKKITLIISSIYLFINALNAQENFKYNETGLTEYIVYEIDSVSSKDLFEKTKQWIGESYVNPDEVLKFEIENEKIRFNGYQKNQFSVTSVGITSFYDARYSIEVSFKDSKIRFKPINLEQFIPSSKYAAGGWKSISLTSNKWLFKKNGKMYKYYKTYPEKIERLFNNLGNSLKEYLLNNKTENNKKEDW